MISIVVNGASGRMGQHIQQVIASQSDVQMAGTLSRESWDPSCLSSADVIIDFSLPEATLRLVDAMKENPLPMVIGTTGFDKAGLDVIDQLATRVPVVLSSNMSVGVNVFWKMLEMAARIVGRQSAMMIDETHHIHKKDHPSGTAATMMRIVEQTANLKSAEIATSLETQPTGNPRLSVVSHRKGEVIGDHSICFDMTGESITLSHHAKDRRIFAEGSVVAARWIASQPAGLYGMADVLGL